MSTYNPDIHHRHSIRLKGYDYASEGLYFVTICTQNRECFFGEIKNNEMVLNDAGRMVEKWYRKTQDKFPDIICHEMVIMPNHFHCIWENVGSSVGADPCVRPPKQNMEPSTSTNIVIDDCNGIKGAHVGHIEGAHVGDRQEWFDVSLSAGHLPMGEPARHILLDIARKEP